MAGGGLLLLLEGLFDVEALGRRVGFGGYEVAYIRLPRLLIQIELFLKPQLFAAVNVLNRIIMMSLIASLLIRIRRTNRQGLLVTNYYIQLALRLSGLRPPII